MSTNSDNNKFEDNNSTTIPLENTNDKNSEENFVVAVWYIVPANICIIAEKFWKLPSWVNAAGPPTTATNLLTMNKLNVLTIVAINDKNDVL